MVIVIAEPVLVDAVLPVIETVPALFTLAVLIFPTTGIVTPAPAFAESLGFV